MGIEHNFRIKAASEIGVIKKLYVYFESEKIVIFDGFRLEIRVANVVADHYKLLTQ